MAKECLYLQERNILVLGRTGTGKRTMANQIFDTKVFEPTSSPMESVTRMPTIVTRSVKDDTGQKFNITILDTYSTEVSGKIISRDILDFYPDKGLAYEFDLIIFAMRRDKVYEEKELQMFRSIIKNQPNQICIISALVITGCENLGNEEREELLQEIKDEEATRYIARFMGKGIFTVGFPPLERTKPGLKEAYQDGIASDAETLKDLATNSGKMTIQLKDIVKMIKEHNKAIDPCKNQYGEAMCQIL